MISLFKKFVNWFKDYRYFKWNEKDKEYIAKINTNYSNAIKKIKFGICIYCGTKIKDKTHYSICDDCRRTCIGESNDR